MIVTLVTWGYDLSDFKVGITFYGGKSVREDVVGSTRQIEKSEALKMATLLTSHTNWAQTVSSPKNATIWKTSDGLTLEYRNQNGKTTLIFTTKSYDDQLDAEKKASAKPNTN